MGDGLAVRALLAILVIDHPLATSESHASRCQPPSQAPARASCVCVSLPQAQAVAGTAVERLSGLNRRTLDVLGARIYSYLSLAHERLGGCMGQQLLGVAVAGEGSHPTC